MADSVRAPRIKGMKNMQFKGPSMSSGPSTNGAPTLKDTSTRLRVSLDDDKDDDDVVLPLAQTLAKLTSTSSEAAALRDAYNAMAAARLKYRKAAAGAGGGDKAALKAALEDSRKELEGELWSIVRDFVQVGLDSPQLLVASVRIMEELEQLKAVLNPGGEEDCSYVPKCHEELEKGVEERFRDLLSRMVFGCQKIEEILEVADTIASDLFEVTRTCSGSRAPFPARFDILVHLHHVYMAKYAEVGAKVSTRIIRDKDKDPGKAMREISDVMAWAATLRNRMLNLGLELHLADAHQQSGSLDPLVDEYTRRMSAFLGPALERIMEMELGKGVDGRDPLRTDLPPEIFRWLHLQVEQARACANSRLLANAGATIAAELCLFQEKYIASLRLKLENDPELEDGDLMASCNDCFTLADLTTELEGELMAEVEPEHRGLMDFKPAIAQFRETAREAARLEVRMYLQQGDHFKKSRFVDGELMEDMQRLIEHCTSWLKEEAFPMVAEVCLEVLVAICVEEFLFLDAQFTPQMLEDVTAEREALELLFGRFLGETELEDRVLILRHLADIGSADSVDMFVMTWATLLAVSWPECPLGVALKLLRLHGFSKREREACAKECQEVYEEHMGRDEKDRKNPEFLKLGYAKFREKAGSAPGSQLQVLSTVLGRSSITDDL